jgi:hypothetical protein
MTLSENSRDLVAVFFTAIFYLSAPGNDLSYLLTSFITSGTVLSRWYLGFVSFSNDHFLRLSFIGFSSHFPVYCETPIPKA